MNRIKPGISWAGGIQAKALFDNKPHTRKLVVSIFDERDPHPTMTRKQQAQHDNRRIKGYA